MRYLKKKKKRKNKKNRKRKKKKEKKKKKKNVKKKKKQLKKLKNLGVERRVGKKVKKRVVKIRRIRKEVNRESISNLNELIYVGNIINIEYKFKYQYKKITYLIYYFGSKI